MNVSFRFVLEKVSPILCGRLVMHRSLNVDPTRPVTGAGRPDRFPSLLPKAFIWVSQHDMLKQNL